MKITEFKKGDKIVRVQASAGCGDRSYMGEKLTFIGIANGCAYCDRAEDSLMTRITGETKVDFRLDWWSEGWEYWIDIENLDESSSSIKYNLKQEIEQAVANEDYELIAELKAILDNSVKKVSKES